MTQNVIQTLLPNPDAIRLPVVHQCLAHEVEIEEFKYGKTGKIKIPMPDCSKVFNITGHGFKVCISYENPTEMWRLGCPLASNVIQVTEKGKPINPLKASKRGVQTTYARKRKNR